MHTREPTPVSAREMATGPLEGEESVCSFPRSPWFLGWKTWPPPFLSPLGLSASGPAQAPPSLSGTHPLAFCSPEKQRAIRWQGWGAGARDQPLRCFSSHPASSILAQGAASPVAHKLSEWVGHCPPRSAKHRELRSPNPAKWKFQTVRLQRSPRDRQMGAPAGGRSQGQGGPSAPDPEVGCLRSRPQACWPVSHGCSLRPPPAPVPGVHTKCPRSSRACSTAHPSLSSCTAAARNKHLMSAFRLPKPVASASEATEFTPQARQLCLSCVWMLGSHTKGYGSSSEAARSAGTGGCGAGAEELKTLRCGGIRRSAYSRRPAWQ